MPLILSIVRNTLIALVIDMREQSHQPSSVCVCWCVGGLVVGRVGARENELNTQ